MKNQTKQVLILDSFTSPYIQQAIIILKSYPPEEYNSIIAEAESVVSAYFEKNNYTQIKYKKKNNTAKIVTFAVSGLICAFLLTISILIR